MMPMSEDERRLWQFAYAAAFTSMWNNGHLRSDKIATVAIQLADATVLSLRTFENPNTPIPVEQP